jgi:hypothetical protein
MRKILGYTGIGIGLLLVIIILLGAILPKGNAFSWSFWASKVVSEGHIKSTVYTVDMLGNDGRVYYFTNKNGEKCTGLVTSEGVGLSCK